MEDWMPSRKDIIADTVAGLVVLAVITVWQRLWPNTGPPLSSIAYTAVVVLCVMIIVQLVRWSGRKRPVTPEEIETMIRSWLDAAKYSVRRDPQPNTHFQLRAEMETPQGQRFPLSVAYIVGNEPIITVALKVVLAEDQRSALANLDIQNYNEFLYNLQLELLRMGLSYQGLTKPLSEIIIQNDLDWNSVTQLDFLKGCFSVRRAHLVISTCLMKALGLPL